MNLKPCYKCQKRFKNCQATCDDEDYLRMKEIRKIEKINRRKERVADTYEIRERTRIRNIKARNLPK